MAHPFKNDYLLLILKDSDMLSDDFIKDRNPQAALDALLAIDLKAANVDADFNKVVHDHWGVWVAIDDQFLKNMDDGTDITEDQIIVSNDVAPKFNYKSLQQAVAEQRVKLGLKKADEDVLINILQNNADECRAYLATRKDLISVNLIPGWTPQAPAVVANPAAASAVSPVPGIDILTAESIKRIQEQAFIQLIIKLASRSKVKEKAVRDLFAAAANKEDFKEAALRLGVPKSVLNKSGLSFLPLTEQLKQIIVINHYKAHEDDFLRYLEIQGSLALGIDIFQRHMEMRYGLAKNEDVTLFQDHIKESFTDFSSKYILHALNVNNIVRPPEKDPANFKDLLLVALDSNDDELAKNIAPLLSPRGIKLPQYVKAGVEALDPVNLKNTLLQRFFVHMEPHVGMEVFYSIHQAKDKEELKVGLRLLGLHKDKLNWIDDTTFKNAKDWAREKSLGVIRKYIHDIASTPERLSDLKKVIFAEIKNDKTDFEEFKKQIETLGFKPVDWLEPGDMENIKQLCRNKAFAIELSKLSKFGEEVHGYLFATLEALPEAKQKKLIERPEQLISLLGAQDESALRHFFQSVATGFVKEDYEDLINENKEIAACKQIRNSALANILVNAKALLDDKQIDGINRALEQFTDLDNPAEYTKFINEIAQISKIGINNYNDEEVDEEVDAEVDEEARKKFIDNAELNKKAIIDQRKYNSGLYKFIASIVPSDLRHRSVIANYPSIIDLAVRYKIDLANVLLRINKNAVLDEEQIIVLENKFKTATSLEGFLASIDGKPPAEPWTTIKTGLTKEFTHTLFNVIKAKEAVSPLHDTSEVDEFIRAIAKVNKRLDLIVEGVKTPAKYKDEFEFIDAIQVDHLADPAFQERARINTEKQVKNHQEIFLECDLMVEKLLRYKNELETYYNQHISINNPRENLEKFELMRPLKKRIDDQLKKLYEELTIYQNRQEKLSKIFDDVDKAAKNRKDYYYQPEHFKVEERDETSITTSAAAQSTIAKPAVAVAVKNLINAKVRENYLLEDRLLPGKARDYNYTFTENSGRQQRTVKGTCTETCPQSPASVMYNNKRVARSEVREFTVQNPLKEIPEVSLDKLTDKQKKAYEKRMEPQNVEFYLDVAVAIFSRLTKSAKKGKIPTKDRPIEIDGASINDMTHIWTALIILAEKNSKIKFGPEAISTGPGFYPNQTELGTVYGFKSTSLYETVYSKPEYAEMIKKKVQHIEDLCRAYDAHASSVRAMDEGLSDIKKRVVSDRQAAEANKKEEGKQEGWSINVPGTGHRV